MPTSVEIRVQSSESYENFKALSSKKMQVSKSFKSGASYFDEHHP